MAKKARVKDPNTHRPRNSGTMTEWEFTEMIHKALRRLTYRWLPMRNALEAAKRPNQSANRRLKYEYQCADCARWFPKKEVDIDHKQDCGSMKLRQLPDYINWLFAEGKDAFQVLCKKCHKEKSKYEGLMKRHRIAQEPFQT